MAKASILQDAASKTRGECPIALGIRRQMWLDFLPSSELRRDGERVPNGINFHATYTGSVAIALWLLSMVCTVSSSDNREDLTAPASLGFQRMSQPRRNKRPPSNVKLGVLAPSSPPRMPSNLTAAALEICLSRHSYVKTRVYPSRVVQKYS